MLQPVTDHIPDSAEVRCTLLQVEQEIWALQQLGEHCTPLLPIRFTFGNVEGWDLDSPCAFMGCQVVATQMQGVALMPPKQCYYPRLNVKELKMFAADALYAIMLLQVWSWNNCCIGSQSVKCIWLQQGSFQSHSC